MYYSHEFKLNHTFNATNSSGPYYPVKNADDAYLFAFRTGNLSNNFTENDASNFSSAGQTFKTLIYSVGINEVQVRAINLEDRFDEPSMSYVFDIKKWAL